MPSTRLVLAAITTLSFTLLTVCGIFNYLPRTQASVIPPQSTFLRATGIGGRWQLVHSSLGLELLPMTVTALPPTHTQTPQKLHRIDFRKHKRSALTPLHFTHGSLREPRVSLKELVVSYRRIAHEEAKVEAARAETRRARSRFRDPLAARHSPHNIRKPPSRQHPGS